MEPLAKLSFKDGYGKGLGWREINARPPLQRQAMVPNWQDYGSSLIFFRLYYNLWAELLIPIGQKSGNLL